MSSGQRKCKAERRRGGFDVVRARADRRVRISISKAVATVEVHKFLEKTILEDTAMSAQGSQRTGVYL